MTYKILAIDDHPETLSILVATLRANGYDVLSSNSPIQGLKLAISEKPDLVLVDRMMPELTGIEVCERIRAHPDISTVPIIMFTAMGEVEHKKAGFESGVDDYLVKPTDPIELIARVEQLLEGQKKAPTSKGAGLLPNTTIKDSEFEIHLHDEDDEIPLDKQLIVMIGARGGVGTTTAALNLAEALANKGLPTTLVDFDLMQGHLGLYLQQKNDKGIHVLSQVTTQSGLLKKLPTQIIPYHNNLNLLLTHPNLAGQYQFLSHNQTAVLVETLLQSERYLVVDLGCGITPEKRPFLDHADQIIVCFQPERIALYAAKTLLAQLKEIVFPGTDFGPLMLSWSGHANLPPDAIENYLGHPLLGHIVLELKDLTNAVNKGVSLIELFPNKQVTTMFHQLAQRFKKKL